MGLANTKRLSMGITSTLVTDYMLKIMHPCTATYRLHEILEHSTNAADFNCSDAFIAAARGIFFIWFQTGHRALITTLNGRLLRGSRLQGCGRLAKRNGSSACWHTETESSTATWLRPWICVRKQRVRPDLLERYSKTCFACPALRSVIGADASDTHDTGA